MPSPLANVHRYFLPWDRPLLPQAVEFLASNWTKAGPLDCSDTVVIVPTRQSGRRLREALASHAATFSAAVFPPRVMLPDSLVSSVTNTRDAAPRLIALLTWAEVFREAPLDEFRKVFPIDPPGRDFGWALRLAQQFTRIQHVLAESGLRLVDVPVIAGDAFPEAERWQQIARLEELHAERLAASGFRDGHAVRIEAARNVEADYLRNAVVGFTGINRIVVLGAPDPQPLALSVLAACAQTIPVDIVIFAPSEEAGAFDEWGLPINAVWTERVIELPRFEERVHLCADPFTQAARTVEALRNYKSPEDVLAVGIADTDVLPMLESAVQHTDFVAFNPEGHRRKGDAVYQLVSALAGLVASESFATVETLGRCPDFLQFLGDRLGSNFSAAEFLRILDRLHTRHLPSSLTEARRHAPDNTGLKLIAELRETLVAGNFPANASTALSAIFEARRFDLSRPSDAATAEAAGAWTEILSEIATAAELFQDVQATEWWDVALRLYGETIRYDEKPPGAIELQGWLELLWEDAPHLVIAGFNDGRVPEAVVGDPFLPEGLRERLGLKTNAARFARDAYLLQALAYSRASAGRLDLLLGKTSTAGDPLRPSRLLLRCADAELPERVRFLFRPAEATGSNPAWRRAWKLTPRRIAAPPRVAVTALRAWLACPFRFYLARVLRMEAVEPAKTELDVLDFGTLCHAALEAMGRSSLMRDCVEAPAIREFLLGKLEDEARKRFGMELTLPLVVQLESARQRLSRAAEVQATTRAEGWVIEYVEENFELDVGGLRVSGKIDRIDRHERTGVRRVLDYKTSDQPVDPWQAHLRGIRRTETPPEFARFGLSGRELVWSDLQLPLYRRALQTGCVRALTSGTGNFNGHVEKGSDDLSAESVAKADAVQLDFYGALQAPVASVPESIGTEVICAYFNLPKAASETGIRHWDDYSLEIDDAAWQCAQGVAAAIRAGEFWPPNENLRPEYDDFASLFHHGVAESVVWEIATNGAASGSSPSAEMERAT